jgi:hypothetical protein
MFRLTREEVARMIADEDALGTLRGYALDEVWRRIEEPEACEDEGEAFNMLMNVMYELRPTGHL